MQGHTRRTWLSQETAWADLPKHIVVLFMRKTLTNGRADSKTFRALQSVCRAWKEAFSDFSAEIETAGVRLQKADDLFEVCKMLPGLASLRARKAAEFHSLFLHPLSACSRLTNLSLSNYEAYAGVPTLDLILLPAALKQLSIMALGIDTQCFNRIKCTGLTNLTFVPTLTLEESSTFELLRRLPKLEALHVGKEHDFDYGERQTYDRLEEYFRLSALTSLYLQEGSLNPIQAPIQCTALQKLHLFCLMTSKAVLQSLFAELPMLHWFGMDDCVIEKLEEEAEDVEPELEPVATLRSLWLHEMPSEFLELASTQLLSLSCRPSVDGLRPNEAEPDVFAIARLTSLTRLELIEYHETCDCSALHSLPLKELLLLDCPQLPEALIVPGVFTELQKLHIAEQPWTEQLSAYRANLQNPMSEGYLPAHRLHRLATIVLSLPSLIQLSGSSRLFALAMAEELEGWHRSSCIRYSMSEYDCPPGNYVWT